MQKKRTKKKNPRIYIVLAIVLLLIIICILGLVKTFSGSKKRMDLTSYFGEETEGEAYLTIGSQTLEEKALISGDVYYLPLSVVTSYINKTFYYDEDNQQILYTKPSEILSYAISDAPGDNAWKKDDQVYLKLDFVKEFTDMDCYTSSAPAHLSVQTDFKDITTVTAKDLVYVRYENNKKADVLTVVNAGQYMYYLEEAEDWFKVATLDGFTGYVQKKYVSSPETTTIEREFEEETTAFITSDQPINLVWHQISGTESNASFETDTQAAAGVNVISPTWFSVQDNAGNLVDYSSADYVTAAHAKGMKVWILVDNFGADMSSYEVLSHTASRQNLITQLVNAAVNLGADGINIDFESLSEDTIPHFLEFLRELSIQTHAQNLVLSVDEPVPEQYTNYYDREEQSKVADYIIIMGYDEHYDGSEVGSVASLPWVEQGIIDTIKEVPASRTILAVPFYTRLWQITGDTVTSEAYSMVSASELLTTNQVQTYWDTNTSQNYGEYIIDSTQYKIWMEDADSIAAKIQLVGTYELAGCAAWRLGLEDSTIWQTISDNLS